MELPLRFALPVVLRAAPEGEKGASVHHDRALCTPCLETLMGGAHVTGCGPVDAAYGSPKRRYYLLLCSLVRRNAALVTKPLSNVMSGLQL